MKIQVKNFPASGKKVDRIVVYVDNARHEFKRWKLEQEVMPTCKWNFVPLQAEILAVTLAISAT